MPLLRGTNKFALPPSPVANLLGTNAVPSVQEAHLIRDMVYKLHGEVRTFMPDPFDHAFPDSKVPAEFRRVVGFIRQHTRLLSAVHTLPDEILEVFFLAISMDTPDIPKRAMRRWMSNVCRRWQSTANSAPRLWSHLGRIDMHKALQPHIRENRRLDQIRLQLERSKPHPISFFLIGAKSLTSSSHRQASASMLSLLAQYSERWESASLDLPAELIPLLAPIRHHLPRLVHLFFGFPEPEPGSPPVFFDYFHHAPLLRSAQTTGIDTFNMLALPLHQLTELYNTTPHSALVPGILDTLIACSSIQTLASSVSDFNATETLLAPSSHLCHRVLKRLYVTMDGHTSHVFERLNLPSLIQLTVRFPTNQHSDLSLHVLQMIHNSSCFLQYLDIRSAPPIQGTLSSVLKECPHIEYLYLDGPLSAQDLSALAYCDLSDQVPPTVTSIAAPHLRLLHISTDPTVVTNPESFGPVMFFRTFLCLTQGLASTPNLKVLLRSPNPNHGNFGRILQRGDPSSMALLTALNSSLISMFQQEPSHSDPISQTVTQWRDKMMKQQRKPSSHKVLAFHWMLKEMEALEVDAKYSVLLYRADIPYLLFKTSASFSLLGNKIYEERVAALLAKWEPMLRRGHGSFARLWIFSDDNTIEFIHWSDARRKSKSWIVS